MDEALKNYFSIESSGVSVSSHPLRSKEDERSMQIMEATTTYLEDEKRWQTGLLWRCDRMHLPDSYQMAVKRLKCLEAKMAKDPPLKEFMMNTMHDYKQKGYIRRLKYCELVANTTSWFLPIFTVTNPNKKKTRLVWDAVAKHPDAVKAICENTFVDDWLQSVDTGAEMIQLAETVKTSNSKQVIQALEDDCEELDKRISAQDEAQEKVLGLWWLPGHDLLTFVVTPNLLAKASKDRPTKRRVLSNIWRSDIGWDDDLTNEDEADWQHWLDLVSNLNTVRVPRCMKWVSRIQAVQMHTFVDASMNAYAAVVFLRAELDGQVHCSLVASKTRVAPLKPVSIPRMELMAAVLGLRLAKCIQKEMSNNPITRRPGNVFSKLEKLSAVQLCVLDFLRNITKKVRLDGGLDLQKTLLLKRSNEMDVIFIRICQEEEFKCFPYVDNSGILRIKGRIDNIEEVEVCVKRPIILPRRYQLTYPLVEFYHRRYHDLQNEIVVNEVRQRYWVCGLRALVREVSNTCPACRIRRARPKPPGMGDLPIERLSPYTPPFTYTGVDYFGPYDIVVGRGREKRWGVLFTCLTVRAVHLDIATSLSTDSYLCVLKSFVARRGCPRRMRSNNGTNFRGASRDHPTWEDRGNEWCALQSQYCRKFYRPLGYERRCYEQHWLTSSDYGSKAELAWHEASESPVNWLTNFGRDGCAIDDIVIIVDDGAKRNCWARGVVVDVHRSKDGLVRNAVVRTADGIITRSAVKLAKLDIKVGNTLHGRS
ncbi:uncharacterized protein [Drosophila virilis]|uniref:uncharacterized protein n=1 Tax=Drosophila virilis TaxID=7244 RepID=UPI0038B41680